jgi:hypothetical protein
MPDDHPPGTDTHTMDYHHLNSGRSYVPNSVYDAGFCLANVQDANGVPSPRHQNVYLENQFPSQVQYNSPERFR